MSELPAGLLRSVFERRIARDGARPLFAAVSGAHLYGFASPDSDFDIRGAHLLPLREVLSMRPRRETIEHSAPEDGRDMDLVSHEAAKFFGLMLRKNGYVLEQVFSPIVLIGGPDLEELRDIARGCVTRHIVHHYRGFAANHRRMLAKEKRKKAKTLLYLYRVLLTGIHALRAGEIESNLRRLLEFHPQPGVADLIHAKVREKAAVEDAGLHEAAFDRLERDLDAAFQTSPLPESPARAADLSDFLVRLRLRELRH